MRTLTRISLPVYDEQEFYVSFWSMFTLPKMVGTADCLRRTAIEYVT